MSKRKAEKAHPTPDIHLPRVGILAPFTPIVLDYGGLLESEDRLFKFSRARAWEIIRHITNRPEDPNPGYWCHWFRAQSLSYQVNFIRSTVAVAKQRCVETPAT